MKRPSWDEYFMNIAYETDDVKLFSLVHEKSHEERNRLDRVTVSHLP